MTKPDFAELKEKLTKLDDVAANEYLTRYMEGFYDEPTYQEYGEYVHTKSAAIISELIDIIQSQSEALESINNDFGFFHHANKRYIESGKDKQDVTKVGTPIRIATEKLETCVSETTTRLQKLRDGK